MKWTQEEIDVLRDMYARPDVFVCDIAAKLGRTVWQIRNKAYALGLKKDEAYRYFAGRKGTQHEASKATRFGKGHVPANKGKKMPPEIYAKVKATMFKKGNVPANHRPVGSERVNVDGYIEVKVAEHSKWRLKHRIIWEQANGPIPKGSNIQFRDHNPLNCELSNLYIITRRDQMANENSMFVRFPAKLVDVIRMRGALKRKINSLFKKKNDEQ